MMGFILHISRAPCARPSTQERPRLVFAEDSTRTRAPRDVDEGLVDLRALHERGD
jgi:hypothetical protein